MAFASFFPGETQAFKTYLPPLNCQWLERFCGEGNGTHSSALAWKIPWTGEPGWLQSMRSQRVGHDWVTSLSLFTFTHWRRQWHPLQCSCLENPRDGGAWWAAVYGVTQSRTRLKWLSSSSSRKVLTIFRCVGKEWLENFVRGICICLKEGASWILPLSWREKRQATN